MSVTVCTKCGMKVVAMSDGRCPSCGTALAESDLVLSEVVEPIEVKRAEEKVGKRVSLQTHFDLFWLLFSLKGRLSRGMLWILVALSSVFSILLASLEASTSTGNPIMVILYLMGLVLLYWSMIAIAVKRFHDLGWPAWLIFVGLFPGLGPIFLFLTIGNLKGSRGPNRYGRDPRHIWSAGMIDEQ